MGVELIKEALEAAEMRLMDATTRSNQMLDEDDDDEKVIDTSSNFFRMITQAYAVDPVVGVSTTREQDRWGRTQSC